MKISGLKILNVLGISRIDIGMPTAVTLFAGDNGTGKSSLQESIRMALLGEITRVNLVKDYPQMVKDGAKEGSILVITDGKHENKVFLPKGAIETADYGYPIEVMASVLKAQRFASLMPENRRTFLFELTNCNLEKTEVRKRLIEDKACEEKRVDETLPMLRADFVIASEFAAKKATEAKASWRGVTGGAYGSLKGASWKAPAPEVDTVALETAEQNVLALSASVTELQTNIATIEGGAAEQQRNAENFETAKTQAALLPRLRTKLENDQATLKSAEASLSGATLKAGTAPRVGLIHDMAEFLGRASFKKEETPEACDLIEKYESEFGVIGAPGDADSIASLPALKQSRDMLLRAVENTKKSVSAAEASEQFVANFAASAEALDVSGIPAMKQELGEKRAALTAAAALQDQLRNNKFIADSATKKNEDAAAYHADVIEWGKIAEALGADGIPGELLAEALKPINRYLREAARATNWMQATITPDMQIRADNRLYALLSESEQWRCDAMIAAAISILSDVRILMLDRVDVLSVKNRMELLYWLDELAAAKELESVILSGTFTNLPSGLPDNVEAHWIEAGEIKQQKTLQAA